LQPIQQRAKAYQQDKEAVQSIIALGCEKARDTARETLEDVRAAMGLIYH
jgi:tryptophanyl-tRNA synthetase